MAFVAHCPEVRENQRVVVVGECPELGGWELGGALSLTPAPCGRPWWVSSEVEVNLSEGTMGVSGDFAGGVGIEGEVGIVRVSELKFRLLGIPNDGEVAQTRNLSNLVCLEPLKAGDFRIVCLVGTSSSADCSSVGERGDNTIRVGVEGGGEQETTEVVGISVEWGVPESVQLALLPRPMNRQTKRLHSEMEHSQSETASRTLNRSAEGQDTSCVSAYPPQSAVGCRGPHWCSQKGRGRGGGTNSLNESERQRVFVKKEKEEEQVYFESADPVRACTGVSDTGSDNRILRPDPLTSTLPLSHDGTSHQPEGERQRTHVPLKRRRSEAALTQGEAEECDEISGYPVETRGKGGGCLREEKQRRLSVSVSHCTALSSASCKEREVPIAGGKVVVSQSDCREGEEGEVKRNRHGKILCLHGRVRYSARSVGGRESASTVVFALGARSVEGGAFASTAEDAIDARSVEVGVSVNTVGSGTCARNVGGRASASTAGSELGARIVEVETSVSTVVNEVSARSAEDRAFVSTTVFEKIAKTVEGRAFVSTEDIDTTARSVQGRAFVFMETSAAAADCLIAGSFCLSVCLSVCLFVHEEKEGKKRYSLSVVLSVV
uniref:CBM20 domain-containing protein n=1 Tax=Chromera velia CCMP2878 TaxID=1169474 RepID=A0A0G4FZK7_9ALVE|eukprot:Cvel_19558.t1-p1 / transcript=Cvel_19558.t1 / gene=Cvel_19558 / organism=Chromera_velia_CCMP2878 / gene_product=Zinc finger protein 571, putative / transcript_product=Zinc finger protein 571, putative / location=Cvel_scaffold1695:37563-39597(-) / protein_length=606 / sequence_SO=supercontig / SO=protein_coding / is_pseudo=false